MNTPKAMRNPLWTRPKFVHKSKHWSYRPHAHNCLVSIANVKPVNSGYVVCDEKVESFTDAKEFAKSKGFGIVRMGAIQTKV